MKNYTLRLSLLFICLIGLWALSAYFSQIMIFFIALNLVSIYIIIRLKDFNKFDIIMAVIFGVLCVPANWLFGVSLMLPYISGMMIFRNSDIKISLYKNNRKHTLLLTLLLIFIVGGALSVVNMLQFFDNFHPTLQPLWFFRGIEAGVFEEIVCRFFLFALCIYLGNKKSLTLIENILCYLIMIIPHTLLHFNFANFDLINVLVLAIVFGIPFTIMQKKNNLTSSMGAHALVDIVRFTLLGC